MTDTHSGLRKGQTAYIVDETGGTFAWESKESADGFAEAERKGGSENVTQFEVTVPRNGMTWDEIAEYACEVGPSKVGPSKVGPSKIKRSSLKAGEYAIVSEPKECDIHKYMYRQYGVKALYDGRTKDGPWANMCQRCFNENGVGLGTGKGQRLYLTSEIEDDVLDTGDEDI